MTHALAGFTPIRIFSIQRHGRQVEDSHAQGSGCALPAQPKPAVAMALRRVESAMWRRD